VVDTFSRKTGIFSVRQDAALVFRIYKQYNQINCKLTIQPREP
jgi:hypothetical protein